MSKLANQWIDIFRAGRFHQGTDKECQFTSADVQQVVDNYDPAQYEAPAVVGHPKHDAPAYAWFSELRRVGDVLQGKAKDVDPTFEAAVQARRFPNRSAKFVKAAKGWTLRHVGFLGAQLPEVKGLAPIQFSDEDKDAVEIEFSAEEIDMTETEQRTFNERMTTFFKGLFSDNGVAKPAEKTFSEAEVRAIATQAATEAVKPFEVRLHQQEQQFSEREKKITSSESETRAASAIQQLKAKGRWIPAFDKMGVTALFGELAKDPVEIEFGEGDSKAKKAPLAIMLEFMENLPKIVPNGEAFQGGAGTRDTATSKGVNRGAFSIDANSTRLHEAALEFAEKNKVDYIEAVYKVAEKHPELTVPGGASAGQV